MKRSLVLVSTALAMLVIGSELSLRLSTSAQETGRGAVPPFIAGNWDARVSVELFNDYQCPPCATFNETLKPVRLKYQREVKFIFRNYPLTTTHLNALPAAEAAEAAGLQGKFLEMIDLLYANQSKWAHAADAESIFRSYAGQLGLNVKLFAQDIARQGLRERILLDAERAKALGVRGTPTAFLNGKEIPFSDLENIDRLIEEALSQRR